MNPKIDSGLMMERESGGKSVRWKSLYGAETFYQCFYKKMLLAVESSDSEDFAHRLNNAVLSRVEL